MMRVQCELTDKHAQAHATHGDDRGNIKSTATFAAHKTAVGAPTALDTAVVLLFLGLCVMRA